MGGVSWAFRLAVLMTDTMVSSSEKKNSKIHYSINMLFKIRDRDATNKQINRDHPAATTPSGHLDHVPKSVPCMIHESI
jgi:hypothetical protein